MRCNAKAKAAGFDNWVQMFHYKKDWSLNTELPTLGPWKMVQPITQQIWLLERNPFYYAVDTAGNQLPVHGSRAVHAGREPGSDQPARHGRRIRRTGTPHGSRQAAGILDNQKKGNYNVHLDLGFAGADFLLQLNQSFKADPEIRKWLTNADFRRALSMGIDRDQLNETFWLGIGTPGSPVPGESMPQNPGPEWRKKWSVLDIAQANAMLDRIGLTKKDCRRLPACAPTTASGCASRSSRCRRSCRIRNCRRWSPTSGSRSASRPTCANWSATWR